MITEADLEKRIDTLKSRLQKAMEGDNQEASRDQIRKIRKRLKRQQRKLRKLIVYKNKVAPPKKEAEKEQSPKPSKEEKAETAEAPTPESDETPPEASSEEPTAES